MIGERGPAWLRSQLSKMWGAVDGRGGGPAGRGGQLSQEELRRDGQLWKRSVMRDEGMSGKREKQVMLVIFHSEERWVVESEAGNPKNPDPDIMFQNHLVPGSGLNENIVRSRIPHTAKNRRLSFINHIYILALGAEFLSSKFNQIEKRAPSNMSFH